MGGAKFARVFPSSSSRAIAWLSSFVLPAQSRVRRSAPPTAFGARLRGIWVDFAPKPSILRPNGLKYQQCWPEGDVEGWRWRWQFLQRTLPSAALPIVVFVIACFRKYSAYRIIWHCWDWQKCCRNQLSCKPMVFQYVKVHLGIPKTVFVLLIMPDRHCNNKKFACLCDDNG